MISILLDQIFKQTNFVQLQLVLERVRLRTFLLCNSYLKLGVKFKADFRRTCTCPETSFENPLGFW